MQASLAACAMHSKAKQNNVLYIIENEVVSTIDYNHCTTSECQYYYYSLIVLSKNYYLFTFPLVNGVQHFNINNILP